jgi:type II secretory pathway pseudopilin PulG
LTIIIFVSTLKLVKKISSTKAFTLVELLVSLGILAFLTAMILLTLNPLYQYSKAYDGQRKQDLAQIRSALDTYYNDHNCYPSSVPFGEEWKDGEVVLMKKVPQDPYAYYRQGAGWYYYNYETDTREGATCPQWNIVFTKLADKAFDNARDPKHCAAMIKKACPGYRVNVSLVYNYCLFSGNIDCQALTELAAPTASSEQQESIPTPTSVPALTPTLTPTGPLLCGDGLPPSFDCRAGAGGDTCQSVSSNGKYCDAGCSGFCPGAGN